MSVRTPELTPVGNVDIIRRTVRRSHLDPCLYVCRRIGGENARAQTVRMQKQLDALGNTAVEHVLGRWPTPSVTLVGDAVCKLAVADVIFDIATALSDKITQETYQIADDDWVIHEQARGFLGYGMQIQGLDTEITVLGDVLMSHDAIHALSVEVPKNAHITVARAKPPKANAQSTNDAIRSVMQANPITGLTLGRVEVSYWE